MSPYRKGIKSGFTEHVFIGVKRCRDQGSDTISEMHG
jgi:hypothetical protein